MHGWSCINPYLTYGPTRILFTKNMHTGNSTQNGTWRQEMPQGAFDKAQAHAAGTHGFADGRVGVCGCCGDNL